MKRFYIDTETALEICGKIVTAMLSEFDSFDYEYAIELAKRSPEEVCFLASLEPEGEE